MNINILYIFIYINFKVFIYTFYFIYYFFMLISLIATAFKPLITVLLAHYFTFIYIANRII